VLELGVKQEQTVEGLELEEIKHLLKGIYEGKQTGEGAAASSRPSAANVWSAQGE